MLYIWNSKKDTHRAFDNVKFKVFFFMSEDIQNNGIKSCSGYFHFALKFSGLVHFTMLMTSVSQGFRQGTEGVVRLCSVMSRALVRRTQQFCVI